MSNGKFTLNQNEYVYNESYGDSAWSWGTTKCWGQKHKWVETGTKLIFCKECDADGEYDENGFIREKKK